MPEVALTWPSAASETVRMGPRARQEMFSATDMLGQRGSWWIASDTGGLGIFGAPHVELASRRDDLPNVGLDGAERIRTRVDLPAPFSPIRA